MRDLLDSFDLDFEVKALPITVYNPDSERYIESNKYKAITRPDSGHIYATCTKRQYILQNETLFDMLIQYFGYDRVKNFQVIKSDINASELSILVPNGKKFSGTSMELNSHFVIQKSFNQKYALKFGIADIVVVCTNGIVRTNFQERFKWRQTTSMENLMDNFATIHSKFDDLYEDHYGLYERLKERKISTKATAYEFIDHLTGVNFRTENLEEEYHARTLAVAEAVKGEVAQSLREQGNNFFGLLQGVTRYTSHEFGPKDSTEEDRVRSSHFGYGARLNQKALQYLEEYV